MTDSGPTAATPGGAAAPRATTNGGAFLVGAVTAGLSLGVCTVSVLLLWIAAPAPAGSPSGALHVAADLWLLAHGADLVRTAGPGAAAVPVGVTPLLMVAVPVALLYRCAQHALSGAAHRPVPRQAARGAGPRAASPGAVLGRFLGGYLLIAAATVAYAATGPLRVAPSSALLFVPLTAAGAAAAAAARTVGLRAVLPPAGLRRAWAALPPGVRAALARPRRAAALRAACAAGAVLLATGTLLVLAGLVWHAGAVRHSLLHLAQDWPGRGTVLLICLLLLPNAAVWGAAYALGPGFTLGAGSAVGPLGATGLPAGLPPFPLLGAVPQEGAGSPLTWVVAVGPVAAGLAAAWYAARPVRAAVDGVREAALRTGDASAGKRRARAAEARLLRWNRRATAGVAGLAALWCGAGAAALAGAAGGPLGTAALRHVGPSWWLTGAAAAGWTAAVAVPGALLLREWYLWRRLGRSPVRGARSTPGR
ncbi:cell division protein PerM [Streptomyces sclerotialus]|uniref:cell division protein PerM n=1 Tax=Streptomyces sclerotialus TaxID=1957 RepID=UPI000691088A